MATYVDLDGVRTWYDEQGAGEPLVMLHPGLVDSRAFGPNLPALAELHRDYLRADAARADEYAAFKRRVAHLLQTDRQAYVDAKSPFVWATLARADDWAQRTGWQPGPSDA